MFFTYKNVTQRVRIFGYKNVTESALFFAYINITQSAFFSIYKMSPPLRQFQKSHEKSRNAKCQDFCTFKT